MQWNIEDIVVIMIEYLEINPILAFHNPQGVDIPNSLNLVNVVNQTLLKNFVAQSARAVEYIDYFSAEE